MYISFYELGKQILKVISRSLEDYGRGSSRDVQRTTKPQRDLQTSLGEDWFTDESSDEVFAARQKIFPVEVRVLCGR